jgi:hypothetical protein
MSAMVNVVVMIAAMSLACSTVPTSPGSARPDPTIGELRAAPLAVAIDGKRIEVQASLWRDFQPISPPDGQPLRVSIRLPAATTVEVERLWVVSGDQTWNARPERVAGTSEWTANEGPKWGPDITVNVVVRVRGSDGTDRLVRAADQVIKRVD